jgi:hypothetical protein
VTRFGRLVDWLIAALVAEAVFAAFLPALRADFVSWDDTANFLANPHYRGLGRAQLAWMLTMTTGHYMPLTWLSHGLDFVLFGMAPAGYHFVNVLLHAVTAGGVYFAALRLLAAADGAAPRGTLRAAAAVAALLFAVHPLRVESVAWVTERRDVLCGVFFVLAVLAYLRARDAEAARPRRWYWTAVALTAAALLSKPIAVTMPAVLLLLDVYPLRRLGPGRWWRREVWLEKVPLVALSLAAAVLAVLGQRAVGSLSPVGVLGIPERLGLSAYGLVFYAWKTLVPTRLAPLYETPFDYAPLIPWFIGSGVLVGVAAIALWLAWPRRPALVVAAAAWVVMLGPTLGLVHYGAHLVADRNTYFAALAPALLAGGGVLRLLRGARSPGGARATLAAAGAVVLVLGVLTWRQSGVWRDSETLWNHTLRAAPSSLAHAKVGVMLDEAGRPEAALAHFEEAVRLHPDNEWAYNNWGIALGNLGRHDEAVEKFQAALTVRPGYFEARQNLRIARTRAANPLLYLEVQKAKREAQLRGAR